jgi:hypothetical protein
MCIDNIKIMPATDPQMGRVSKSRVFYPSFLKK